MARAVSAEKGIPIGLGNTTNGGVQAERLSPLQVMGGEVPGSDG
jgi:hypothetical protein